MKNLLEKELTREISKGEQARLKVMAFISLHAALLFVALELIVPRGYFIDAEKTVHGLRFTSGSPSSSLRSPSTNSRL